MPIELRRFRQRLVEEIALCLADAIVYGNVIVSTWSLRGLRTVDALPKSGPVANALNEIIGESPLETFVCNELLRNFAAGKIDGGREAPLSSYEGYEDLSKVAGDLVDSMGSLPWSYSLTLRLPSSLTQAFPAHPGFFQITDRQRVVTGKWLQEHGFPGSPPVNSLFALAFSLDPSSATHWQAERLYIQVLTEGYLGTSTTESYLAAREAVQTILGLAFAFGIFSEFKENYGKDKDGADWAYVVHRSKEELWELGGEHPVTENHKRKLSEVVAEDMDSSGPDSLVSRLGRIGEVLGSPHGTRIARAARWLFESRCHEDPLHQFIHAAVAMEILLGEEKPPEGVSTTQLLANRCAYLISRTPEDRASTLKAFKKIYDLRSSIVHTGKSRLSGEESRLLLHLRLLCDRVIYAEHALIKTSLERAEKKRQAERLG